MGYNLQTFICRESGFDSLGNHFDKAVKVYIGQELCLMPMTEELFDQVNNYSESPTITGFTYLTQEIENEILSKIENKMFAYVEAGYFGGQGEQASILWKNGRREKSVEFTENKINHVLKELGAVAMAGKDEFETLILGRHRETIDWIESAE